MFFPLRKITIKLIIPTSDRVPIRCRKTLISWNKYVSGQINEPKDYLKPTQGISIQNISSGIVDDQFRVKIVSSNLQVH